MCRHSRTADRAGRHAVPIRFRLLEHEQSSRGWDLVWYVAARIGALAIALTSAAIVITNAEHQAEASRRAVAAHRAILEARQGAYNAREAARQRALHPPSDPALQLRDAMGADYLPGSKSGFGGLGLRGTGRQYLPGPKAGPP